MISLLPNNSTQLQQILEQASLSLLEKAEIGINEITNLRNPTLIRADLLPYLAWELGVDEWDLDWDEQTKRNIVANAYEIHSIKGTVGAIKRILELSGYGLATVTESQGDENWWTFQVTLNTDIEPSQETIGKVVNNINRVKPVRSCLEIVRSSQQLHNGTIFRNGTPRKNQIVFRAGADADCCSSTLRNSTAQYNGALNRSAGCNQNNTIDNCIQRNASKLRNGTIKRDTCSKIQKICYRRDGNVLRDARNNRSGCNELVQEPQIPDTNILDQVTVSADVSIQPDPPFVRYAIFNDQVKASSAQMIGGELRETLIHYHIEEIDKVKASSAQMIGGELRQTIIDYHIQEIDKIKANSSQIVGGELINTRVEIQNGIDQVTATAGISFGELF